MTLPTSHKMEHTDEHGRERLAEAWEEAAECGACGSHDVRFSGSIGRRRFAVCRGCGIERLYDRVAESSLDPLYGNYYAPGDPPPLALEQQLGNPTFAHRRRRLRQFAGMRTRRILEIGCGDGNFLETLRRTGWDVHGQEVSVPTAAIAGRRHGIPVTAGALETIPSAQPFPVVAAYHVFEHIYHPAAWLRSVHRLIEPRGLLHVQVPNGASLTPTSVRRRVGVAGLSAARLLLRAQHTARARRAIRVQGAEHHDMGPVARSRRRQCDRVEHGKSPRHGAAPVERECVAHCVASHDCASPRARSPIKAVMRTGLGHISVVFARLEAAIGRGAVVDIVAQRSRGARPTFCRARSVRLFRTTPAAWVQPSRKSTSLDHSNAFSSCFPKASRSMEIDSIEPPQPNHSSSMLAPSAC